MGIKQAHNSRRRRHGKIPSHQHCHENGPRLVRVLQDAWDQSCTVVFLNSCGSGNPRPSNAIFGSRNKGLTKTKSEKFGKQSKQKVTAPVIIVIAIIMKFSPSAIVAAVVAVTASTAAATHVKITVTCTGVDFAMLPIMEDVYVGSVLQESFNNVHNDDPDDDIRLSHVNFGLHQDDSTRSPLGFYYGWNGSYGCISCRKWRRNDDDDFIKNSGLVEEQEEDVAAANNIKMPMVDGEYNQLWNAEFAKLLMESGSDGLEDVGECFITMEPDLDAEAQDANAAALTATELSSSSDVQVAIEANCDGVDFAKIPLSQHVYIGNLLQATFRQVHGDDERLSDVTFGRPATTSSNGNGSFFGWNGAYGCSDCQGDESLHGQWEAAFTKALVTGDHEDFTKVGHCTISMAAPMEYDDVSVADDDEEEEDQAVGTSNSVHVMITA